MIINIIGGGPRGLSVALYAIYKGHTVNLIDPSPTHTWSQQSLISDLEMRSPLSFDLVTFLPELQHFSLAKYLGIDFPILTTQNEVENNNTPVSRVQFCNYLNYIYTGLKNSINLYFKLAKNVIENKVILEDNTEIQGDAVVFCIGHTGENKDPNWILDSFHTDKRIKLSQVLINSNEYLNKNWLVVGSGQGAAETVRYLATLKGKVTWSTNKVLKVYQYPAPDHLLWGSKSALGSYYRSLTNYKDKGLYLSKVKQWQPSITPYINNQLNLVKDSFNIINLNQYTDLSSINYDYLILNNGVKPSIKSLPIMSTTVPSNMYLADFPYINKSFKLNIPNCNWYVSGILAIGFDGPRQASIISSGLTAKEIIQDIENVNI